MPDRFTSREVIALTGITARQLQWWDERGVVKPAREGHRRLYSMNHLTEVAVIFTDGTHLYLETSARQIVDILKNSSQPILGICLSDAVRQVRAGVISRKANTSVTSPDQRRRAKKAS